MAPSVHHRAVLTLTDTKSCINLLAQSVCYHSWNGVLSLDKIKVAACLSNLLALEEESEIPQTEKTGIFS